MAKRTRGSSRPGRRAPLDRDRRPLRPSEPAPQPSRPPGGLTAGEEARAAEIEAAILAEERAAEEATRRARERGRGAPLGAAREAAPLTVRAASEYAYVRRDILRIARIGGSLLLVLAVLHVLINVAQVIRI
jgi:hypothetical protein